MLSREGFCKALRMIRDQESIDEQFSKALNLVGNGHFVFGTENKYLLALRDVLKEAVNDQYDYIDWWLYEAADDFEIWEADCTMKYCLKEPEALYDFITGIEDEIEDVMDRSSEENIFSNIIIDTGGYFLLDMFDEYGRTYKVEITSVYDFIKMIVSIRQIRCEFFPYEKK